jgi:hypothetical protein
MMGFFLHVDESYTAEQVLHILFGLSHSQQVHSLVPFLKGHSLQAVISELPVYTVYLEELLDYI